MQVKKIEATNMQEALRVIKKEMGPDAIILSVKENRKRFGIMSKASVEVTVAISEKDIISYRDSKLFDKRELKSKKILQNESYLSSDINVPEAKFDYDNSERELDLRPFPENHIIPEQSIKTKLPKEISVATTIHSNDSSEEKKDSIEKGALKELKEENKVMLGEISELKEIIKQISYEGLLRDKENFWKSNEITNEVMDAYHQLISAGIEKRFARELIKDLNDNLDTYAKMNFETIIEKLALTLMKKIKIRDPLDSIFSSNEKPSIFILIGPTGVGKTTTAAKIASQAILKRKLKVGLINLDQYKVSADEQLLTYSKIIGAPFYSVRTKEGLLTAVEEFSKLDLILIDTAGVGQKDQTNLTGINQLLSVLDSCETMLMLSSTTKETDINDIVNRFMLFKPSSIIYSKLDETSVYGSIYNTQARTSLPLSYFTVGQQVPEDIEKATFERLTDLILKL